MISVHQISQRQACQTMCLARSTVQYIKRIKPDDEIIEQLRLLVDKHPARRRHKKRLPARVKQALFAPETINKVWSVDFMGDSLWDGRKFRLFNIVVEEWMFDYNNYRL